MMKFCYLFVFLHILTLLKFSNGKVLELDERFLQVKSQGTWLVMFYAPWCGHCKSLEPTWIEIGKEMQWINPDINVARVDATKHSSVAQQFGVQGFPTIKFFQGKKEFEYRGQRTKEDIIAFTSRAQGPATKELHDEKSVEIVQGKHEVFYLYVGEGSHPLRGLYNDIADTLMTSLDFYTISASKLIQNIKVSSTPTVVVFKDGTYYEMPFLGENVEYLKLKAWVMSEQISSFNELSAVSYGKLRQAGKLFCIAVVTKGDAISLKDNLKIIALQRISPLHEQFAFTWVEGTTIPNSLTYDTISEPNILIFDTTNYKYYTMFEEEDQQRDLNEETIKNFLNQILDGKIPAKGGSGVIQQMKRIVRDILNFLINLFRDSPVIGTLVIGLPTLLVSMLCYCICTIDDSYREGEYDSEDEEEISGDDYSDHEERRHSQVEEDSQAEDSQAEDPQAEDSQAEDEGKKLRKRKAVTKAANEDDDDEKVEDPETMAEDDKEEESSKDK